MTASKVCTEHAVLEPPQTLLRCLQLIRDPALLGLAC